MKRRVMRGLDQPKDTGLFKLLNAMWKCGTSTTTFLDWECLNMWQKAVISSAFWRKNMFVGSCYTRCFPVLCAGWGNFFFFRNLWKSIVEVLVWIADSRYQVPSTLLLCTYWCKKHLCTHFLHQRLLQVFEFVIPVMMHCSHSVKKIITISFWLHVSGFIHKSWDKIQDLFQTF
jgi:hypothetical protein